MFNPKRSKASAVTTKASPTAVHHVSLLTTGVIIHGDVRFGGTLHMEGRIIGSVRAEEAGAVLTVSKNGIIEGGIDVPQAIVNGEVRGNIQTTEHLDLGETAQVTGDVHYRTLTMAPGARVNGRVCHQSLEAVNDLYSTNGQVLIAQEVAALVNDLASTKGDESG